MGKHHVEKSYIPSGLCLMSNKSQELVITLKDQSFTI